MLARHETDLAGLLEMAVSAASPTESLRALAALRTELAAFERAQVQQALDRGATFSDLARSLGISRQAAHRRYRRTGRPEPIPLESPRTITREASAAIEFALDEAARRGSPVVDSAHFLAGVVATAGAETAARLDRLGITVAAIRRQSVPAPAAKQRPRSVGRPLREVLTAGGTLDLDRLVLATLDAPDGRARDVLEGLAVPPRALIAALRAR
jgi:transposase-like protein